LLSPGSPVRLTADTDRRAVHTAAAIDDMIIRRNAGVLGGEVSSTRPARANLGAAVLPLMTWHHARRPAGRGADLTVAADVHQVIPVVACGQAGISVKPERGAAAGERGVDRLDPFGPAPSTPTST
jgi:hypothetical protein